MTELLWYSDFYNFKKAGISISGTPYWKMQHGPVPIKHDSLLSFLEDTLCVIDIEREVLIHENLELTKHTVIAKESFDRSLFTERELYILKHIEEAFRAHGSVSISNRSHEEDGWLKTIEKEPISYSFASTLSLD